MLTLAGLSSLSCGSHILIWNFQTISLEWGKETSLLQEAFTVLAKRKLRPQVEAGSYEAAKSLQNKH